MGQLAPKGSWYNAKGPPENQQPLCNLLPFGLFQRLFDLQLLELQFTNR